MASDASGTQDVRTYLTKSENSRFAGKDVEMVERWQGRDNLLWQCRAAGQEAVLKLFLEAGQVRADRQFRGQERFAPWGLAPRPLWQDRQPDPVPRPILVYEWIEGETFAADGSAWEALADAVAHIHSSDPGDYTRFSPHPINLGFFWRVWQGSRAPLDAWLQEQGVELLQRTFSALWQAVDQIMEGVLPQFGETAPTLIHGDLLLEHVLHHRGQMLLVDWEFFGLGDPAQEVARFLFFNRQAMDEGHRQQWLARYLQGMDDLELARRIEVYRHVLPFQSLTSLLSGIQRELAANPAQMLDLEESRPFLVETITAALVQSAITLPVEPSIVDHEPLREQVNRLLGEGS